MFCPDCGAEFRPEISECPECGVSLVHDSPTDDGRPAAKIVPVFRTTDAMLLPIVKSLLDSAGIPYFVQGEEALNLFPLGRMGSKVSRASIGAIVHVGEDDAESVNELLAELRQNDPDIGGIER